MPFLPREQQFSMHPHTLLQRHTHTEKKGPKPGDQGTQKSKQLFLMELQVVLNILSNMLYFLNAGWGKSQFTVVRTQNTGFILLLLFINCIIFHMKNCKPTFPTLYIVLFLKDFIYLFLERRKEKEKKRGRKIDVWEKHQLPLTSPQMRTWPATQACVLTGNRTSNLSECRLALSALSHTSQGCILYFYNQKTLCKIHFKSLLMVFFLFLKPHPVRFSFCRDGWPPTHPQPWQETESLLALPLHCPHWPAHQFFQFFLQKGSNLTPLTRLVPKTCRLDSRVGFLFLSRPFASPTWNPPSLWFVPLPACIPAPYLELGTANKLCNYWHTTADEPPN